MGSAHGQPAARSSVATPSPRFTAWRDDLRGDVGAVLRDFVGRRATGELAATGVDIAADVLLQFVDGGKYLRSAFAFLGWRCGGHSRGADAAIRAAASFELLQAFALLQDDVMDSAALRRGRPAAHVRFADWHRERALSGPPARFGDSAAILLGDLCLVWSEQLLRESGLPAAALDRAWPRYDAMRTELAIGQFADLVNDARGFPSLEVVLEVARRKSGNYTVRRPLEIGAAAAGCGDATLTRLGRYGAAVGEAFQLRDDILGIFGTPTVTGKPIGSDLAERKATSVVVAAHHMADPQVRRQLVELMSSDALSDADIARWRQLIAATGAAEWIEEIIADRVAGAIHDIDDSTVEDDVATMLADMAGACTTRLA